MFPDCRMPQSTSRSCSISWTWRNSARVWGTFSQPFRLSVLYEVSVVQLDMLGERPMAKRVQQVGVPDIRAPFLPPVVEHIEPLSGPAGTVINVHGQHLSGWRAYVTIMGRMLTPQDLTGDTFQVPLPGDLPVGFHEIGLTSRISFDECFSLR